MFVWVWPTLIGFGTRERFLQIEFISVMLDVTLSILAMTLLSVMGGIDVVVSDVGSSSLAWVVSGAVRYLNVC